MTDSITKTIKRYQNRKFYDTTEKCYINIDDMVRMLRENTPIKVVCQKTKNDITEETVVGMIPKYAKLSLSSATNLITKGSL